MKTKDKVFIGLDTIAVIVGIILFLHIAFDQFQHKYEEYQVKQSQAVQQDSGSDNQSHSENRQ